MDGIRHSFRQRQLRIACYELGHPMFGIEIDHNYYEAAEKRLIDYQRQLKLFDND